MPQEVHMPGPFFWFVVIVGVINLVLAIKFALRPTERSLAVVRPLCAATIFSALAAFLMGTANGLVAVSRALERAQDAAAAARVWPMFLSAVAESPAPLVLGFALVAVVWLLVAVGLRRQA
jgi:hypothetical protein